ncbi:MAG TPA: hypothetical protein VKQ71_08625 [Acidimicrobiales bacterium]|nr:hypothetical protein [Acidimicrobiales bacterium]
MSKSAPTRRLRPGDLVCGQCGEGNDIARKFCSRCGNSLGGATIVGTSWWRKFVPHRKDKVLAAGERPGHRGQKKQGAHLPLVRIVRSLKLVLGAAILIAGLVFGIMPSFRHAVNKRVSDIWNNLKGHIVKTYVPVHPSGATATSQLPDHPAGMSVDGFKNTYWAAGPKDASPVLILAFQNPTDLSQMIIRLGDSDNFGVEPRPAAMHIVYDHGAQDIASLQDKPDPQTIGLHGASKVTRMEIHVVKTAGIQGSNVSITEIELFSLKK